MYNIYAYKKVCQYDIGIDVGMHTYCDGEEMEFSCHFGCWAESVDFGKSAKETIIQTSIVVVGAGQGTSFTL